MARSDKRGRSCGSPGVVEFGTLTYASCTGTGRPRRGVVAAMVAHAAAGRRRPQSAGASEESDAGIVPKKPAKTRVTPVESVEGRAAAKGKSAPRNAPRAQGRERALTQLERIGQRAKEKRGEQFNNLLSHIKVPLLTEAYQRLRKDAAPGVDGVTWDEYGEHLDARLLDLQDRIHRGSYHPQPVRRVHIPKGDGRTRRSASRRWRTRSSSRRCGWCWSPSTSGRFWGSRTASGLAGRRTTPWTRSRRRSSRKVNWVLDADIRSFFDTIDHGWMQKFIEHRIGDRRMVRLLMKWLHAGVMEDGELREVKEGTPQGGIISPLLANIYLHYALDLWVQQWRKRQARGEVYIVRYADDFVMGFQYEAGRTRDARGARRAPREFGLELHPDKTRVLRFGRFACEIANARVRRPETFDFLGFTHIAGKPSGWFQLQRRTSRKKRKAKLAALREEMRRRRHDPSCEQHAWLPACFVGTTATTACPRTHARYGPSAAPSSAWHRRFNDGANARDGRSKRRSCSTSGSLFLLPASTIPGPPDASLARRPEVGARCGKSARRVLSGGRPERAVPTGTAKTPSEVFSRIKPPLLAALRLGGSPLARGVPPRAGRASRRSRCASGQRHRMVESPAHRL